jgi:hypothetical protein
MRPGGSFGEGEEWMAAQHIKGAVCMTRMLAGFPDVS